MAIKQHGVVVICHFKPETLAFLTELNKEYYKLPIELMTVPQMLKYKSASNAE